MSIKIKENLEIIKFKILLKNIFMLNLKEYN